MAEDYYAILNIPENASVDEIKHAFRVLALQVHPDVNPSPEAKEKFILLTRAYEYAVEQALRRVSQDDQVYEYDFSKNWEQEIREIRKEMKEQARKANEIRKEKVRRQKEELKKSGLYDLSLALRYLVHFLAIFLGFGLIAFPVIVSFQAGPAALGYLFFFWLTGLFLLFHIYSQRGKWLRLGKFFYHWKDVVALLRYENPSPATNCWYCRNRPANGHPYKHSMLFIKDIQLQNKGPLQHYAGYKRDYATVLVPRSRKAFYVHSINTLLKVMLITLSLLLLPLHSYLWRFLAGLTAGGLIAAFVNLLTLTRPKSTHLFSPVILFKMLIWILIILALTRFEKGPDFYTSEDTLGVITLTIFFLDLLVDPLARLILRKKFHLPIFKQPLDIAKLFSQGYQNNLEIPIWSTFYPLFHFIF